MAVKLRGAPLTAPVYRGSFSFSPSPLMAKLIRNGDQVDLNVNTCWLKWRPFVSLGSGRGGGGGLERTGRKRLLTGSSSLFCPQFLNGARLPVCVARLCAHIHECADEKCPRPCNTTWLVINKSVKWQERFLNASFRLWNVAMMRFQICACVFIQASR